MTTLAVSTTREKLQWRAYVVLLFAVAAATLIAEVGMHGAHSHASAPLAAEVSCSAVKRTIDVNISDIAILPATVSAHLCDKIVFHNAAAYPVEIAFGPHEHHTEYPGLSDAPMPVGGQTTLLLIRSGTYPMHDHDNETVRGQLTVQR